MSRRARLFAICCLFLTSMALAAKKKTGLPPLRFPFGLTPAMTPEKVSELLTAKGLTVIQEKDVEGDRSVVWRLNGQIQQGFFIPTQASLLFVKNKLSSISFNMSGIPECGLAQSIFASALEFSRHNYDQKDAPITEEPPVDTIDCGPHAPGSDWHLRRENKKTVLITEASLTDRRYEIKVGYYDRATMKAKADDAPGTEKDKPSKSTQENL